MIEHKVIMSEDEYKTIINENKKLIEIIKEGIDKFSQSEIKRLKKTIFMISRDSSGGTHGEMPDVNDRINAIGRIINIAFPNGWYYDPEIVHEVLIDQDDDVEPRVKGI